jgi:hypothetical protein
MLRPHAAVRHHQVAALLGTARGIGSDVGGVGVEVPARPT